MYANLRKEILDEEGKVVFRNTFSMDMETTTPELIEYFLNQGYVVDSYTTKRIYRQTEENKNEEKKKRNFKTNEV